MHMDAGRDSRTKRNALDAELLPLNLLFDVLSLDDSLDELSSVTVTVGNGGVKRSQACKENGGKQG
jgi:hypothetical protein